MKELVEITREPDPSSTRSSVQDIAVQADAKAYVKCVTNVNNLVTSQGNHQNISPQWRPRDLLLNGA